MDIIDNFSGEHNFLSNFYASEFEFEGIEWQTVEHMYQAYKTTNKIQFAAIVGAATPGKAKRLGRTAVLRDNWEDLKDSVMHQAVTAKFTQNRDLMEKLIDTWPNKLVEGNTWGDRYWGVYKGEGKNMLGITLEAVRSDIVFNYVERLRAELRA